MFDVLVVGSGGAGLRAAIAAKEKFPNLTVALITKGQLGKSGVTAKGYSDRMAFHATLPYTEPGGADNWKPHADDVYRIGGYVSDPELAEILAKNSNDALQYLLSMGVPFQKNSDGKIDQFVTDGSIYARAAYTGPDTAVQIEKALVLRIKEMQIKIIEHHAVISLLKSENSVSGVLASSEFFPNEPFEIEAKAVIMATGGGGQIYAQNVFPPENTGEGFAIALDAGAELVNMEFIQLGVASLATKFNCSGSMFRAIPSLVNDAGEELLPKQFDVLFRKGASWPTSLEHDTHIIDVLVYREMERGKKVFLDYSKNPEGFKFSALSDENQKRYLSEIRVKNEEERDKSPFPRLKEINPRTVEWFKERGIDIERGDKVEVGICGQHFQGGIKIGTRAETAVRGLYAVGECAGGQHGANRPGGHALLDCQVFGKIAGECAAEFAQENEYQHGEARTNFDRDGGIPASEARAELQKIVSQSVSVFRTGERMKKGLERLLSLKSRMVSVDDKGKLFAIETIWMFDLAESVIRAALARTESRGPHLLFSSEDTLSATPRDEANWRKCIVIRKNGDIHVRT